MMRPSWSRDRRPAPWRDHALLLGLLPYFAGIVLALVVIVVVTIHA